MHVSENELHCWERSPVLFYALALEVIPIICLLVQENFYLVNTQFLACTSMLSLGQRVHERTGFIVSLCRKDN